MIDKLNNGFYNFLNKQYEYLPVIIVFVLLFISIVSVILIGIVIHFEKLDQMILRIILINMMEN